MLASPIAEAVGDETAHDLGVGRAKGDPRLQAGADEVREEVLARQRQIEQHEPVVGQIVELDLRALGQPMTLRHIGIGRQLHDRHEIDVGG